MAEAEVTTPETEEMTQEELAHRIDTDPQFANDFLDGKVQVDDSAETETVVEKTEPDAPEAAKPADNATTTEPVSEPTVTQTDDGKFEVLFEDGSKLVYKSKNEALKGLREKETYIRHMKTVLAEEKGKNAALAQKIAEIESRGSRPAEAAQPKAANSSLSEAPKVDESLDPFDPEYQKQLLARQRWLEDRFTELITERAKEKEEMTTREKQKQEREEREQALKSQYSEANTFASSHSELSLGRPIEVVDREYKNFFDELGQLAGTDGSVQQKLDAVNAYNDPNNAKGQALKAKAEALGIRPPENLEKYFEVRRLLDKKNDFQKRDEVTGLMRPFTLEETYNHLRMLNGGASQQTTEKPAATVQVAPRAQAIAEAERIAREKATDVAPTLGGQPLDVSGMDENTLNKILDYTRTEVMKDSHKKNLQLSAYKFLKIAPPGYLMET